MLHSVRNVPKGRTTWCGPSALDIITGCGYDRALDVLRLVTGKRSIKGTTNRAMLDALAKLSWTTKPVPVDVGLTLAAWLRGRSKDQQTQTFLINVTGHYVVVRGRKGCDSHTKEPVWISDMPFRRSRVQKVWMVKSMLTMFGDVDRDIVKMEEENRQRVRNRVGWLRTRRSALAEMKRLGLTYVLNREGRALIVEPPDGYELDGLSEIIFDNRDYWEEARAFLARYRREDLVESELVD